jgi:hypothetical protein
MQIPENGFYYHYKHDESKGFNDHAYEVIGVARHSEDKSFFILYRPLYENDWLAPAVYQARPTELFFDDVAVDGKTLPHFWKITDPILIEKLTEIKDRVY